MDIYYVLDIIFGLIFLAGTAGYWIVTRHFTDLAATYRPPEK